MFQTCPSGRLGHARELYTVYLLAGQGTPLDTSPEELVKTGLREGPSSSAAKAEDKMG